MKLDTSYVLGITAAILHGIAFIVYNVQAERGQSKPNAISWFIWAFLAVLNAGTYKEMTSVDETLQFYTGSVACTLTFLYLLVRRKFGWPKKNELIVFVLCIVASLVWLKFRNAINANLITLLALMISFKPTYNGVEEDPFNEKPLAWTIWTVAFSVTALNSLLSQGISWSLATPMLGAIAHGGIVPLCSKKRKEKFLEEGKGERQ